MNNEHDNNNNNNDENAIMDIEDDENVLEGANKAISEVSLNDEEEDLESSDEEQDEEDFGGYKWEKQYERSWASLKEDSTGRLMTEDVVRAEWKAQQRKSRSERRKLFQLEGKDGFSIRRGIVRNTLVIVDMSKGMASKDIRPRRNVFIFDALSAFVREFCDQNPVSEIGFVCTNDKKAELMSPLSGIASNHLSVLSEAVKKENTGEPSLQNALAVAEGLLKFSPSYASKEILLIYSSLSTVDGGDIYETIAACKKTGIRITVIGFAAEVHILKVLADSTGGRYTIVGDELSLTQALNSYVFPRAMTENDSATPRLVTMGFPQRLADGTSNFCVCHSSKLTTGGYFCPRCKSKICSLPSTCPICGLMLVSSPHLARAYHHLFPVPFFDEVKKKNKNDHDHDDNEKKRNEKKNSICFGCLENPNVPLQCPKCRNMFCIECDSFIHSTLNNCPGCQCRDDRNNMKAVNVKCRR